VIANTTGKQSLRLWISIARGECSCQTSIMTSSLVYYCHNNLPSGITEPQHHYHDYLKSFLLTMGGWSDS